MFKLTIFVAIVAAVYAAEEPARVARQGLLINPVHPAVGPTLQPLVAGNPYVRHQNYQPHQYARGAEAAARILTQQQDAAPDGSGYAYAYETENGIAAQEQGQWRAISPEEGIQTVVGSFRFPLPDGRLQITEYQADENGYRPVVKYQ